MSKTNKKKYARIIESKDENNNSVLGIEIDQDVLKSLDPQIGEVFEVTVENNKTFTFKSTGVIDPT